jgi:HlyD family secretion protein
LYSASISLQNVSSTIYAPITGVITGLSLQEGSVIPAQAVSSSTQTLSQNVASITTSDFPIISVSLTEIDIPKVKAGDKATLTFDAFPDKTFTGRVFSINTTGSVSSGVTTYPTTIILDSANASIYANMSVTANIIIDTKDEALYVPSAAVQTQNSQQVVRELKDGVVQYIPVTTGISSDSYMEITSGLSEGEEIITSVVNSSTTTSTTSTSPFGIRTGGGFARPRD